MMQTMGILSREKIECCDGRRLTLAYNNHTTKPVIYSVQSRDTKLRNYANHAFKIHFYRAACNADAV